MTFFHLCILLSLLLSLFLYHHLHFHPFSFAELSVGVFRSQSDILYSSNFCIAHSRIFHPVIIYTPSWPCLSSPEYISLELNNNRKILSAHLYQDFGIVLDWGARNLLQKKTIFNLNTLYVSQVKHNLDLCSHKWKAATLHLLDAV